ncbi:MAG: AIR synthase related protein, partial [bacterium]
IGTITAEPELRIHHQGITVASLPPDILAKAPAYQPAASEPQRLWDEWTLDALPEEADPGKALLALLASPDIASKRPIYEQYDHSVQVRTVVPPGAADAAVLRIHELGSKGLALTVDGSGRLCARDPYRGARLAVAECAANLACVGAAPLGLTDCLNFGNPEDPEVFWTFRQAVSGIADACRAMGIPVVGGNVSFYNESIDGAVPPTPIIAMVGVVDDVSRAPTVAFQGDGNIIVLVGDLAADLAASTYLEVVHGVTRGRPPHVDFQAHQGVLWLIREGVRRGVMRSAHDCSEGGAAVAIAECCIAGGIGASVTLPGTGRGDGALFGESPSRVVISLEGDRVAELLALAAERSVPVTVLGCTGGARLEICLAGHPRGPDRHPVLDLTVSELTAAYQSLAEVFA